MRQQRSCALSRGKVLDLLRERQQAEGATEGTRIGEMSQESRRLRPPSASLDLGDVPELSPESQGPPGPIASLSNLPLCFADKGTKVCC